MNCLGTRIPARTPTSHIPYLLAYTIMGAPQFQKIFFFHQLCTIQTTQNIALQTHPNFGSDLLDYITALYASIVQYMFLGNLFRCLLLVSSPLSESNLMTVW